MTGTLKQQSDRPILDLLAQSEKIDRLDKHGAYTLKLHSVRHMQSLGIADSVIESMLGITLLPADRNNSGG